MPLAAWVSVSMQPLELWRAGGRKRKIIMIIIKKKLEVASETRCCIATAGAVWGGS